MEVFTPILIKFLIILVLFWIGGLSLKLLKINKMALFYSIIRKKYNIRNWSTGKYMTNSIYSLGLVIPKKDVKAQ